MSRAALIIALLALVSLNAACTGRPTADDYLRYQKSKQAEGKLRTETDPADAPFDRADLVRNFERIALRHETNPALSSGADNWSANPVTRWHGPLRYALKGSAVQPADRAEVRSLTTRIAKLTGLEIAEDPKTPNFTILITTPEQHDIDLAYLKTMGPIMARTYTLWRDTPSIICLANNQFAGPEGNRLSGALVVIGAEVTGLLRQACLHEEIVQALGLANDHPDVRPSIFNDDGEFALLTRHDEYLLRMLYDPRLTPGMTGIQALPILRQIAAGLELDEAADPALIN